MINTIDFNSSTNTLSLGNGVYLEIELSDIFAEVSGYTQGRIYVRFDNQKILIFEDFISAFLSPLQGVLRYNIKLTQNRRYKRLIRNIGYIWNQEEHNYWVLNLKKKCRNLDDFYLSQNNDNSLNAWIYKKANSYIFELTPAYKWHSDNPPEGEEVESYEDFMKRYKPVLKTTLSVTCVNNLIRLSKRLLHYYYADCA